MARGCYTTTEGRGPPGGDTPHAEDDHIAISEGLLSLKDAEGKLRLELYEYCGG